MRPLRPIARTLFLVVALCAVAAFATAQPRIGLVYRADHAADLRDGKQPLARYRGALEDHGAEVVPLTVLDGWKDLNAALAGIDALLLPGGGDVDPKFYNEPPHETLGGVDAELDRFEFRLLDRAFARKLPVLGICRGHQALNVYLGGSLIQDIPTQVESDTPVIHRYPKEVEATREHAVSIVEGTLLHDMLGSNRIVVTTYHHQAAKDLGRGLVVAARADDGVVEAVELPGDVFVVGVQFHPERKRDDERFDALFRRFVEEATDTSRKRERSAPVAGDTQDVREQEPIQ